MAMEPGFFDFAVFVVVVCGLAAGIHAIWRRWRPFTVPEYETIAAWTFAVVLAALALAAWHGG
jgi:hypothetical protein